MRLTREQLDKLEGANLANLAHKVAAGKCLSSRELKTIRDCVGEVAPPAPDDRMALPTYDSMAACSGATGIPLGAIKAAKKAGCSAFTGSRVSLEPLLRWIFSRDPEESSNWGDRLKRALALRAEHALDREKGRSWDAVEVQDAIAAGVGAFFRAMEQGFDPLPAKLLGLDSVAIRSQLDFVQSAMSEAVRAELAKITDGDQKQRA